MPLRHALLICLVLVPLSLTACAGEEGVEDSTGPARSAAPPGPSDAVAERSGAQSEVEFEYEGERGPEAWGGLSPEYARCAEGSAQSPIDLADALPRRLPELRFDYQTGDLELENTTHTVQVNETPGSALEVGGRRYPLLQFHFHEPSEHTVDGRRFDGELHFVHRDDQGRTAVVAVLARAGKRDRALDPVFSRLPEGAGRTSRVEDFNPASLLPGLREAFRYSGSLTTPPCDEGVQWFILRQPIEVSRDQLAAFRRVIEENHRPTQPRNEREVLTDAP